MGKKIKKVFNKPSLITEWQEWEKVPEDLPKRWSKPYGDDGYAGLTEFESNYGDDRIKLGKLYTDKDRPPFKTIKEEFAIDDEGWKNVTGMIKGFFEDMKEISASISGKSLKKLYRALDGIDKRQLGIKDVLKKHMKEAYPRYDKDGKEIEEGIKRWKVYIKGESKPLILTGKDERDVKQIAYAMIRNSSVKIAKVVREGKYVGTETSQAAPPKSSVEKQAVKIYGAYIEYQLDSSNSEYMQKDQRNKLAVKMLKDKFKIPSKLKSKLKDKKYHDKYTDYNSMVFEGKLTEGKTVKYRKNDWKKYNQLVKKGKSVMVQTAFGDQFAWEDGSNYGVFASEDSGREIELDHDDIDQVEIF